MEVSKPNRQCWSVQDGQIQTNTRQSYTALPSTVSPQLTPFDSHVLLPRNGNLFSSTPCHASCLPWSADSMTVDSNESSRNILDHQHNRNLVPFKDTEKTVILQHPGYLVTTQEPQVCPMNKGNRRARYELFYAPRKPPRTFSQTSLTNGLATCSSFTSRSSHKTTSGDPTEWECPQVPLAEDEVKDAYTLSQPNGG